MPAESKPCFTVIDNITGEKPWCERIILHEGWACRLNSYGADGFRIGEYGTLFMVDDCGNMVSCPEDRFTVRFTGETALTAQLAETTFERDDYREMCNHLQEELNDTALSAKNLLKKVVTERDAVMATRDMAVAAQRFQLKISESLAAERDAMREALAKVRRMINSDMDDCEVTAILCIVNAALQSQREQGA